jgi:hypothetical protein
METKKIEAAIEDGMIKAIKAGALFKFPYESKIDLSVELREAYENIDYRKVYANITELLEEELAKKIVNKVVTEMGTDIKKLMANVKIRDDFRFLMRKGVETIMEKVKEEERRPGELWKLRNLPRP